MNETTNNSIDASLFSCSDIYIANYLDKNIDKEIIEKLDDIRLSSIISYMNNKNEILEIIPTDRLKIVLDNIDIYVLKNIIINNKKYYHFLNENKMDLLYKIINYGDDKVGYHVSNKYIFNKNETSYSIIEKMNNLSNIIYVIDDDNKYLGMAYLSDLIDEHKNILELIKVNYPKLDANTHTSDFIRLNHHYYMDSYPVVDGDKLIGVLSPKSINDLLVIEMEDDYYKLSGITENRLNNDGEHLGRKLPWLFVALFTNFALALVLVPFVSKIINMPILAMYWPFILMISGACASMSVGSSLMIIRKHNTGIISGSRLTIREIKKSIIIGLVLFIISFVVIYFYLLIFKIDYLDEVFYASDAIQFSLAIATIIFTCVVASSIVGFIVPIIIDHFEYDYSIATLVLITSMVDIISSIIFFGFSYMML